MKKKDNNQKSLSDINKKKLSNAERQKKYRENKKLKETKERSDDKVAYKNDEEKIVEFKTNLGRDFVFVVKGEYSNQEVIEKLQEVTELKGNILFGVIGEERHSSGEKHYQIAIQTKTEMEFLELDKAIVRKGYSEELKRLEAYFDGLKKEDSVIISSKDLTVGDKSLTIGRKLVSYPFTSKDIDHMTAED